jgi:hypothetical protein
MLTQGPADSTTDLQVICLFRSVPLVTGVRLSHILLWLDKLEWHISGEGEHPAARYE